MADWQIDRDWRRLAMTPEANFEPPMQCQYANPGPIQCQSRPRFGLAISRQSVKIKVNPVQCKHQFGANRGSYQQLVCCQSNANRSPMSCQFAVNPRPPRKARASVHSRSSANPSPILCQSNANLMPMQIFDHKPIRCQSVANLMSIECQSNVSQLNRSIAIPSPIWCQSGANLVPIHRQFCANRMPI